MYRHYGKDRTANVPTATTFSSYTKKKSGLLFTANAKRAVIPTYRSTKFFGHQQI
jgi:hypothetical protein